MKAKRVLSALMAATLTASLAACGSSASTSPAAASGGDGAAPSVMNETGLPIVNEPVTLKIVSYHGANNPDNFEGVTQIERLEKETGVNLEFSTVPATAWETQKTLVFSSGDIPDMIVGNQALKDPDVASFAEQGLIVPLQDLVKKYGPNLTKILDENPLYNSKVYNKDGEMWSYPALADIDFGNRGSVTFVNKSWLKEAGIEVEYDTDTYKFIDYVKTPFTTEDFHNMLKKFKELHPNSAPWMAGIGSEAFLPYYASFGAYDNNNHLRMNGDKVEFSATDPKLKDGIKWVHDIWSEGLIDPETFTMDDSMATSKVKADNNEMYGVVTAWTMWAYYDFDDPRYDNWAVLPPLVGPDGTQEWPESVPSLINGFGVITAKSEHPEICARFMDNMYTEDNSVDAMIGPLNGTIGGCVKNEDGTYTQLEWGGEKDGVNFNDWMGKEMAGCFPFICPPSVTNRCVFADPPAMTIEVGQVYRPYQVQRDLPGLNLSSEASSFNADFSANAMDFIKRKQAEWITGGGIDEEWDAYVTELGNMGSDQYVEYYQDAYDDVKQYLK